MPKRAKLPEEIAPTVRPQKGLSKAEFQRELERSGLMYMLKQCYPTRQAQKS